MRDVAQSVNFQAGEIPATLQKHHSNRTAMDFSQSISNRIAFVFAWRNTLSYL